MIDTKEYNEILLIIQNLINSNEIKITDESFSISFLKQLLITHPLLHKEILSLKEKSKINSKFDYNIFEVASKILNKKNKFNKVLLNNIDSINMLYNEPFYVINFNNELYSNILNHIIATPSIKLIESIQDNLIDKMISIQPEEDNYENIFNVDYILEQINKIFISTSNKKSFCSYSLDYFKKNYLEVLINIFNQTEENINSKKRRESIIKLIKNNKNIQLLEIIKSGVPNCLRKNIYISLLNISQWEKNEYDTYHSIFLIDYIILNDIHKICSTENYFLFVEELIKMMACFIRDTDILTMIQGTRPFFIINTSENCYVPYPPCGLFPNQGLPYELAPFCYMSNSMDDYYIIAKKFYIKYLSFLSTFSTNKNSIISLISSFDNIYSTCLKDIKDHLSTLNYDINRKVLFWFLTSFTTVYSPDNVFRLYDMVLISDGLSFYVLSAISLIYYKKEEILKKSQIEEIEECLNDIYYEHINVYELMQKFLLNNN